ncbi:MAG: CocE/NonD family hydrolase [Myxococcota bacterium]|nr:CocE/NonD family hydrolase [Myxococcota bacterium]
MTKKSLVGMILIIAFGCDADPGSEQLLQAEMSMDAGDESDNPDGLDADAHADAGPQIDFEPPPVDAAPLPGPSSHIQLRVGVEAVTVFGAVPGSTLTLLRDDTDELVSMVADPLGQAHFAYIPAEFGVLDPVNGMGISLANGAILESGVRYIIRDEATEPWGWSDRFEVLAIDDIPDTELYSNQRLRGVTHSPITGASEDLEQGFQYITMRDGVTLSAMVRLPDPVLYGDGPYPTVVEYSGYAPSRPNRMDAGTRIANALGYATVSVNMRGTGCSGGVFDFFNRAQHADGYDVIETIARQPWVLNHKVGMVGLSYPGISQLYVASTNPPSLAAVVPLSTIADAWEMQWPGGIYNAGFTRQWVEARESDAAAGGASWVRNRIDQGDEICANNQTLSVHSLDFESILRTMAFRPTRADDRDLRRLVAQVKAPVFLGGLFQDEQTGAQFGDMLDNFINTRSLKAMIGNGRHPDGFAPQYVSRWFEFLEFYVAGRIPELHPLMRTVGATEFGNSFGMDSAEFEPDRFIAYPDYDSALAAYENESSIRVLFENGFGGEQTGAPVARFVAEFERWPAPDAESVRWFMNASGRLDDTPVVDGLLSAAEWQFDPNAGTVDFFGEDGYRLLVPVWNTDWTRFAPGQSLSFQTEIFDAATVIAGPGLVGLWIKSPVDDVTVQATLSEVTPMGYEVLIQSGWLRLSHRKARETSGLRLSRSFSESDFQPLEPNIWTFSQLAIPSFAHAVRAGSALRITISTPGRDHGTWEFQPPAYDDVPRFQLGLSGEHASSLTLVSLPGVDVPAGWPSCPSLRGQPCRPTAEINNRIVGQDSPSD